MKKYFKQIILLCITFIFLYIAFNNVNFHEFISVFKKFDYKYLFLLIISITISLSFRAVCFKQLIYKSAPNAKLSYLIPICLAGGGLNILLPARVGDIFRAYFTGEKYNCSKMKIFGSVMLERLFDVLIIFLLLSIGIFFYNRTPIAEKLCLFSGILIFIGIMGVVITYKFLNLDNICKTILNKTEKLPFNSVISNLIIFINKTCNSFFTGFDVIESPKRIFYTILASFGIWFFDCLNYFIVIHGFGYDFHWSICLFIISFLALACMIPSASIFVGPYQVAVIMAFAMYGAPKELALAVSISEQTVVTIYLGLVSVLFILKNNISFSSLKEQLKSDINKKSEIF